MLNHCTLLGRLAQAPELRSTPGGISVTSFDLAVPVYSKDKNAPPEYIPIVCWREQAEFVSRYLAKGRQIVVEGRISTRKYTDNDGKNHKVVEVIASRIYFADSNTGSGDSTESQTEKTEADNTANDDYQPGDDFVDLPDDGDLPF